MDLRLILKEILGAAFVVQLRWDVGTPQWGRVSDEEEGRSGREEKKPTIFENYFLKYRKPSKMDISGGV